MATRAPASSDRVWVLETNLDDLPGEVVGHATTLLMAAGALDAFLTPIQMKKNRPGVMLSVLCRDSERESLSQMLFAETTTLGLRSYPVERRALQRESVRVETPYGPIDVKVAKLNGHIVNQMPEYERGHQEEQHAEQRVDPPAVGSRAVNVAANGDNLPMGHIRLLFPVDHGCLPSRHREGP